MNITNQVFHFLFQILLRLTGLKHRFKNLRNVLLYINNEHKKPALEFDSLPSLKLKSSISKTIVNDMSVYLINENASHQTSIIYFHGGAFINQPLPQHFNLVDSIAQLTESTIIFPCYSRLPDSNEVHCLTQLNSYIEKFIEEKPNNRLILMGDSAGGWLALSIATFLRNQHKKTPEQLILFSPWCDLSMSDVNENLEKKDPILSHEGLRQIGIMWKKDSLESVQHGYRMDDSLKDIGDIHIYVGSHEILLTQTQALKDKAQSQGVNLNLKVVKMMSHDFILFPFKESKEILSEVIDIINKN